MIDYADQTLTPSMTDRVIVKRLPDGSVASNVPHRVCQHSPTGYELGYSGSGPADLALNILENTLILRGFEGDRIQCYFGDCFVLAFGLYQQFKWDFVAGSEDLLEIEVNRIVRWIESASGDLI